MHEKHNFQEDYTPRSPEQDIFGTNLLTKFHEDRKINVASRVLTRNIRACDRLTDRRTACVHHLSMDISPQLAQTNRPTNQPTNRPTDRAKTICTISNSS
ncbi:hypothetical protein DPMN_048148 [Dreissena polymorpha]|uniref:Uncharacterized protein n=1 Tax=Dreissena polymorpha TaxID=45954 RepID=A0A9D4DCS7_DREPO|nr:hypothetical protein DPMN_048148 [Dreissena polymorpha]